MKALKQSRPAARFGLLAGLACSLLLLASCVTESEPSATPGKKPRLVIIALDGLEPTLLEELLAAGRLPTFQRLIDNGSLARIDCVVGTTSPVVWTTVATGVSPKRHGVTGFTLDDVPVTSTIRRVPALWNMLPAFGISSAFVGWMVTWPAEIDSGIVISDRAHWGKFEDKVAPAGVIDLGPYQLNKWQDLSFLSRFTSYSYDPEFESRPRDDPAYAVNFLLQRRLINIFLRDAIYSQIAEEILKRDRVDVMAVYLQGADYVSHGFWKYFEPEPFREDGWTIDSVEVEQLKDIIPKYYMYLDRLIGKLLALAGTDASVMIASDHGFGTALGKYKIKGGDFLSGNHRFQGVLILSGPQFEKAVKQDQRITHFDLLPTALYSLGLPLARSHEGHPLLQYFSESHLSATRVAYVATYGQQDESDLRVKTSEHDDALLEELKSLGYIE